MKNTTWTIVKVILFICGFLHLVGMLILTLFPDHEMTLLVTEKFPPATSITPFGWVMIAFYILASIALIYAGQNRRRYING